MGLAIYYLLCTIIEKLYKIEANRKIWLLILALPLLFLLAFRAPTVGCDTLGYFKSYMGVSDKLFFSTIHSRMELGYIYYMRIISLFGFNYLGFQVITSAFTMFSISRFVYRYSANMAFSFFIFMTTRNYFGTMNVSRQYLAVAILLFSIEFIRDRKPIKFIILVLIATNIHFSAIIFLLAYPITCYKLDSKSTLFVILVGILISISFEQFIEVILGILGRYEGYLGGKYFIMEGKVAIYFNLLINFLFFMVAYCAKYWKCSEEGRNQMGKYIQPSHVHLSNERMWYAFCLLTLIFSIMGLNSTILTRVELYFSIFYLVFIPSVLKNIKHKEIRTIVALGITVGLFASFLVVMVYRPNWTNVFPYQWYWNW